MHSLLNITRAITISLLLSLVLSADSSANSPPLVSIATHDAFFDNIRAHCGNAYAGKIVVDTPSPSGFEGKSLVMHVRRCNDAQLQIPFHVGDDHSRTWVITKTGSGLSLKHDHRKPDGSDDPLTMYGGHTFDAGFEQVQSFPADIYSKQLFIDKEIPVSVGNTWQIFIYEQTFTYRMVREGREFKVEFDLTKPVDLPPTPWGYKS